MKTRPSIPSLAACAFPLLGALLLAANPAGAQTLRFIYVAPAAQIDANFGTAAAANPALPTGYKQAEITAANLATFTAQAPPHVLHIHTQLQTGTTLRNRINRVLTVSGGLVDVDYFLVDDRTGLTDSGSFTPFTVGTTTHVWPAAQVREKSDGSGRFQGSLALGEAAGIDIETNAPGGILAWEGTALHETSHTQWVGQWTKWGSINQRAITYGDDGDHYQEELLGDMAAALDEGIASFYGFLHNDAERRNLIDFFKSAAGDRYFVENRSVLAGNRDLQAAPHTQGTVGRNNTSVSFYAWRDVPAFLLLFSESTGCAFNIFFWQTANGNRDQALDLIVEAASSMWRDHTLRDLFYETNRLALALERYAATPQGQAAKTAGTLTSSMYPFALLDILTHFGMTDAEYQREYRRNYPDRDPAALAEYFANHRASVQRLVEGHLNASPIEIEQAVGVAHRYFQNAARILEGNGVVAPTN